MYQLTLPETPEPDTGIGDLIMAYNRAYNKAHASEMPAVMLGGQVRRLGESEADGEPYQEARVFPRLGMARKLNRNDRDRILGLINWEKIRDEITVPLMNDIKKGAIESRDSANSFM